MRQTHQNAAIRLAGSCAHTPRLPASRPVYSLRSFSNTLILADRWLSNSAGLSRPAQQHRFCCYCSSHQHDLLALLHPQRERYTDEVRIESITAVNGQLPDVLVATFPMEFRSLSSARKACRKRTVLVDGALGSCATSVAAGQVLQVLSAPQQHLAVQQRQAARASAVAKQLQIVHMDEHLLVVVKPFGLHVYGRGTGHFKHWLSVAVPASSAADALPAACPVHRLDALTGGLVVCARTLTAARGMTLAFEQRRVKKQYRALLAGQLQQISTVDLPVNGKPASTQLQVISHTRSLKFGWITTANLYPETGRKHQLRSHMSALGHPILGDPLYNQFADTAKLAGRGLCLWSQQLHFEHPVTGLTISITTEEPARFDKVRQQEAQRHAKFTRQDSRTEGTSDTP